MHAKYLSDLRACRDNFAKLAQSLSLEQLNAVPPGFGNNIAWNLGHVIVTQQLLCYKLAGLPMMIPDRLVEAYRKGTRPEKPATQAEIDDLLLLLRTSADRMEQDMARGSFQHYQRYATSYGVVLESFEDALRFNTVHESLHLGYAMALRKLVAPAS
jgi:hypothetical protein